MACSVTKCVDGTITYTIETSARNVRAIARYKTLPRSWQVRIDHLIDSILEDAEGDANVVDIRRDAPQG